MALRKKQSGDSVTEPSEPGDLAKEVIAGPDYLASSHSDLGLQLLVAVAESHRMPLSRGVTYSDINILIRSFWLL